MGLICGSYPGLYKIFHAISEKISIAANEIKKKSILLLNWTANILLAFSSIAESVNTG